MTPADLRYCPACKGDVYTPWQAGGGHEQYCPNDPSQYEAAVSDLHAALDRAQQLREAGNELARWLSLGLGTSTRTSTTDLMLDLARWREVAGDG